MRAQHLRVELAPEARSVSVARSRLAGLASGAGSDWVDAAVLALSEVVTNAIVHSGAPVVVEAWVTERGIRVQVADRSPQLPSRRYYAATSGTGRGLHILDQSVDRWGTTWRTVGKCVWFELGEPVVSTESTAAPATTHAPIRRGGRPAAASGHLDGSPVRVTLLNVPLLMVWAWQEHAQALLREYLLFGLGSEPRALDDHADASDALSILHEQVPVPELPDDPEELLAGTLEPSVSAPVVELQIAPTAVAHFRTLVDTLRRASAEASRGSFLGPPMQPEIGELRDWIGEEVTRQAVEPGGARPWMPRTGIHEPLADGAALRADHHELLEDGPSVLATDEASIIIAVSPTVVGFLGYRSDEDLLGRRVIAVVPHRYHQAHIAGTTLNASNGRDALLDTPVTVPVLRADATEVAVRLRVVARRSRGSRVFVAHFGLDPDGTGAPHPD